MSKRKRGTLVGFVLGVAIGTAIASCGGDDDGGSCRCAGAVTGGLIDTACGTSQCVGGAGYRCVAANMVVGDDSACGVVVGDGGGPPPSCSPVTCSGCCSGTTCLGGDSSSACGTGGAPCVDCGPSFVCSARACTVDPASRWAVVIVDGTAPEDDYSGLAWDPFGGLPDPVVEARVGSDTATPASTSAIADTLMPSWNQTVIPGARADALRTHLDFTMLDFDPADANDPIGRCPVDADEAAFRSATKTLTCPRNASTRNSGFTLRWRLVRN